MTIYLASQYLKLLDALSIFLHCYVYGHSLWPPPNMISRHDHQILLNVLVLEYFIFLVTCDILCFCLDIGIGFINIIQINPLSNYLLMSSNWIYNIVCSTFFHLNTSYHDWNHWKIHGSQDMYLLVVRYLK